MELFSPHLLIRGVVEPFSAKSIVGSSKLWPCLAFFAYCTSSRWQRAGFSVSQDKLTDVFDVNNAVPLSA